MSDLEEESEWTKHMSRTHKVEYWQNVKDGRSVWEEPECFSRKRRKLERVVPIDVAIIVPFRDVSNQQRRKQLDEFLPKMNQFLSQSDKSFRIYIIEQSDDDRKFNRGKLLNIGFDLACKDGCSIFIFHDVDLLPSDDLLDSYTTLPVNNPIHIARMWDRYNKNPKYFGGVVSFSREMFERINGFPNNFWGELYYIIALNLLCTDH